MINVSEEMKHLHKLAKQDPRKRFTRLWEALVSPEWLAQAWEQIRGNKGSLTAGADRKTAFDVDPEMICKLAEELKTGRYRPTPARRVYIPKANGKTRPLGILTIKDRTVQQALRMLLEPIFEADFSESSHGFRQGRSPHTALRDVARYYPGSAWIIEGDIVGCYDNIPHGRLMRRVARRVADEKVLGLIRQFLQAGYLEDWQYHRTYSGTPQGGILSPLLANIFLHQLDQYMEWELKANRTQSVKERNARSNPEYMRLANRISKLRRKLKREDTVDRRGLICEIEKTERQLKKTPCYSKDKPHPCKVKYARYADDFLILVAGSRHEAEAIRQEVSGKLSRIGLTLSEEKTKLTHWSKPVQFLGYTIRGKMRDKGAGIRAVLTIPDEKIRKAREAIGKVGGFHHIPEADAIVQMGATYRGWCTYYRFANRPQQPFNALARFMWWQYAHYLARKQKSSIAAMIRRERKAGRLCRVERKGRIRNTFQIHMGERTLVLDIFPPKTGQIRRVPNSQEWKVDLKPLLPANWQSGRSLATRLEALDRAKGVCERCGERPVEHIHHTVPLRGKSLLRVGTRNRSHAVARIR